MQGILTLLTDELQAFLGPISVTGMSAHGASLARVVGVYLDSHRTVQERFVGNHAVQLGKRPFGGGGIGTPLLLRRLLAMLALGSLSDVCQVLQSNEAVWMSGHDVFGDYMIGVLFQPSLSTAYHHQTTGSRASAFLLQTLSQSRVVVGFGNDPLARMERTISPGRSSYRQVTYSDIHTSYTRMCFRCWLCSLYFKGDQQIELFLGFVVPQLCSTDMDTLGNQSDMLMVARVGDNDTPGERQDAHMPITLKAVVLFVLVGQRGRDVLRRLVKSLVAFLGLARLAQCCIVLDLCP